MVDRPLGVTIIGILWILLGLLTLSAGLLISILGTLIAGVLGLVVGAVIVILGLIDIAFGVGCFMAWPWVWILCIILAVIHLLLGLAGLFTSGFSSLLGIIITGIILYYLFQPNVKAWFGQE
jgi:hypothetical protein